MARRRKPERPIDKGGNYAPHVSYCNSKALRKGEVLGCFQRLNGRAHPAARPSSRRSTAFAGPLDPLTRFAGRGLAHADGRSDMSPSTGLSLSPYRSGWWRARHGPAVPARFCRSPPPCRIWVAKEWRRACGVALSARPKAPRRRCIRPCASRGLIGLPRRERNSAVPGAPAKGISFGIDADRVAQQRQHRHDAFLAALAQDGDGFAQRDIAALQRQRFGNAQARAIKKRQKRRIARAQPFDFMCRPLLQWRGAASTSLRGRGSRRLSLGVRMARGAAFSRMPSRARKR